MIEDRTQSQAFGAIADELVAAGLSIRFQARGRSMLPAIRDGEILHVQPVDTATIRVADLVLFKDGTGFKAHRVVQKRNDVFVTRGDAGLEPDNAIRGSQIMGKIIAKECAKTGRVLALDGLMPRMKFFVAEGKRFFSRQFRRAGTAQSTQLVATFILLSVMLISPHPAAAQQTIGGVALDNTNSQIFTVGGNGSTCAAGTGTTWNCSFTHTTSSVALSTGTGLLLVGFSINTQGNGSDSQVTAVTYNGISMGSPPVNYGPGNNFRLQIYYLKSSALTVGTHTVAFTVNKTGGQGNPLGLVAGAITLYQVNQTFGATYPITATNFGTSATASVSFSGTNKPGTNDGVIDVLAVIQGTTVTPNTNTTPPLVFENQQWTAQSGTSGQDVSGASSSAGGIGATLTMQEGLGTSTAWAIAAIAVPASQPTAVKTDAFSAAQTSHAVLLSWHTSGEMHNLGFNVYRDIGGQKAKINPSLIAGSALLMREAQEQHGARTYGWIDRAPAGGGLYWLEDVDLTGTRTMHGPVSIGSDTTPSIAVTRAITLQDLAHASSVQASANNPSFVSAHVRETVATPQISATAREIGFHLASHPAVKILADHEGWYRVTQSQLVAAGFSPSAEARSLHLFAEGVEQPIRITGASSRFGPQAAIEFYGTAIDTPYSGQRVYWLVSSSGPGKRISTESAAGTAGPLAQSFIQTLELKPRTTYFAALLHENTDNFFGPLVSPEPAIQIVNVSNLVNGDGTFEIALQGVTLGQQHNVTVMLNGATLGSVNFVDQEEGKARFQIPAGVLATGANTITLTAQQGDNDLSVVDYINVSFPHSFTAASDLLKFTADAGESVKVGGFTHTPVRLIDITNPAQPFAIAFRTTTQNGTFTLETNIPWTSPGRHTLLALSDAQLAAPAAVTFHRPSNHHSPQAGAEAVMLTAPQFADQIRPLAELRRSEGKSVAVVNINDVYDEFNFGEPTPYAIRAFLRTATRTWHTAPHYLLLAGDASVDPRNYLGFGSFDFVPTKIVITSALKTASDDWFSDFENTGFAKIATGRLPARTASDMQTMVSKIAGYNSAPAGSWTNQSMLVADVDDASLSFTQAAMSVQKMLPQNMNVTDVFASSLGAGTARQNLLDGINAGQLLVNYNGHGSVEIWGSGLFDDTVAASLSNGNKLPMFVAMNCLNGFFHDVYTESLATALMLAPNGGAVSVWASSGLTEAGPQFQMNQALMQGLFSPPSTTIGDAVLFAKSGIADADTRKTFILFGDPMMQLKTVSSIQSPLPTPPSGLSAKEPVTIPRRAFNQY